jgi:hypothetical protein
VNYPIWVTGTNWAALNSGQQTGALKALALFVAIEKLRNIHNGIWNWVLNRPIAPAEDAVLGELFAAGNPWGVTYPGQAPSEAQARNWLAAYWETAQQAAQDERANLRLAIPIGWFGQIDLKAMFFT